jgi:hypothetical protein
VACTDLDLRAESGPSGSQGEWLANLPGLGEGEAIYTIALETADGVCVLLAALRVMESAELRCLSIRYDVRGLVGLSIVEVMARTPTCVALAVKRIGETRGARSCHVIGVMRVSQG